MAQRRGFTQHHNGPPAECIVGGVVQPHPRCVAFWEGVRRFHMVDLGWSSIAYSFGVCPHGARFVGGGWSGRQFANGSDTVGADDGDDSEWYTVLWFVGGGGATGYPEEHPNAAMVAAAAELITEGRLSGRCGMRVLPHNWFKHKPCPGPTITELSEDWDGRPITTTPEEEPPMGIQFATMTEFENKVKALMREVIEDVHKTASTDTRQGIFDMSRSASILGGFLCWAEDAVTGDPVYWWTPVGKIQFPQGSPTHNHLKVELMNRSQSPNARRLPVAVLDEWPTIAVIGGS